MALSVGMEVAMIWTEGALRSCVTPTWMASDQKHVCSFRQCLRVWEARKGGKLRSIRAPQSPLRPSAFLQRIGAWAVPHRLLRMTEGHGWEVGFLTQDGRWVGHWSTFSYLKVLEQVFNTNRLKVLRFSANSVGWLVLKHSLSQFKISLVHLNPHNPHIITT